MSADDKQTVLIFKIFLSLYCVVFVPYFLLIISQRTIAVIESFSIDDITKSKLLKYDKYTYLAFLGSVLFAFGIIPNLASFIILLLLFLLLKVIVVSCLIGKNNRQKVTASIPWLSVLFALSGFAALIYQIVWQRILFTTFGVNVESVTVIVSLFMLGLGVGAIAGGMLSKFFSKHLVLLFCIAEIAIGVFGLFSIDIIHFVENTLQSTSILDLSIAVYAVLAFPTLLMGATLPLLVAYLHTHFRNIGQSVGTLYALNTFGSAIAAFLTVNLLFVVFGLETSVIISASCNLLTALLIYIFSRNRQTITIGKEPLRMETHSRISFPLALLLSAAIGYISLSQEILWFRIIGFATANSPEVFGMVLCAFLTGIGMGSLKANKICEQGGDLHIFIARALIISTIGYYFSIAIIATASQFLSPSIGVTMGYLAIGGIAFFTGSIFPVLCHMSISREHSSPGSALSIIYSSNILGATLGPLLTGFVLLEYFSLSENIAFVAALSAVVTVIFIISTTSLKMALPVIISCIVALFSHHYLYDNLLEKIQHTPPPVMGAAFKHKNENRSGIITVMEDPEGDIIYGGGIYDGKFNIDPVINSNWITRIYMMAALHPKPKRVLEIGLSSGSWAKVISSYSDLKTLDSIEINKGYAEIINHYPEVSSILNDKKVTIHFDDGRRWLNNYSGEKFDFIVMNTTYFWRANSSNLLSVDFLRLCKEHLKEGGVMLYNTTSSADVVYSAAHEFEYVTMVGNFVAVSNSPFSQSYQQKKNNLLKFMDENGQSIFQNHKDDRYAETLHLLALKSLENIRDDLLTRDDLWLITDDNMASEYKVREHFYKP